MAKDLNIKFVQTSLSKDQYNKLKIKCLKLKLKLSVALRVAISEWLEKGDEKR